MENDEKTSKIEKLNDEEIERMYFDILEGPMPVLLTKCYRNGVYFVDYCS